MKLISKEPWRLCLVVSNHKLNQIIHNREVIWMTLMWMRTLKVQPMSHPHSAGYVWGRSLPHSSSHWCAGRFLKSSVCTGQYSWLEERVKSLLLETPTHYRFWNLAQLAFCMSQFHGVALHQHNNTDVMTFYGRLRQICLKDPFFSIITYYIQHSYSCCYWIILRTGRGKIWYCSNF